MGHLASASRFTKRPSGVRRHPDVADLRLRPPVDRGTVQRNVPHLPGRADSCRVRDLDGLLRVDVAAASPAFAQTPRRAMAWFLAIAGVGIAALWLSEIVAALPDGLPTNIHLSELPNPTWVLDLGWIIPSSLVVTRLWLRRGWWPGTR